MRRNLIVLILIVIIVMALPAQASWLSTILFGRHTEYHTPGITYAVDEQLRPEWEAALDTRYWNGQTPIFQGTILQIGVLIESGTPSEREFFVYVTDPTKAIKPGTKLPKDRPKTDIGGLRLIGESRGKYGPATLDTSGFRPGTYFLYTYVKKGSKYEKFAEEAVPLHIGPPPNVVIEALKDASDEILKEWGLESYPTLKEVTRQVKKLVPDTTPVKYDIVFNDGGKLKSVALQGKPRVGRVLAICSPDTLMVGAPVVAVEGNTLKVNVTSDCIKPFVGHVEDLTVGWAVKVYKYQLTGEKKLDAEQQRNLMTYPDGPVGSSTFGLRNIMVDMATMIPDGPLYDASGKVLLPDTVVHLRSPFAKNTSGMYQLAAQVFYANHFHLTLAPNQFEPIKMVEAYVPEVVTETIRCVRLAAGGVPVVKVDEATSQVVFTPGLSTGAGMVLASILRKADKNNISANANNKSNISNANSQSTAVNTTVAIDSENTDGSADSGSGSTATSGDYLGGGEDCDP